MLIGNKAKFKADRFVQKMGRKLKHEISENKQTFGFESKASLKL
jgi:hypothetical protein